MAAGIEQQLYIPTLPYVQEKIPNLMANYLPGAQKYKGMASGQGVVVVYTPSGPVIEYNPAKVKTCPRPRRAARLGQGEPEEVHICATRELRSGTDTAHGPAVRARRHRSARSRQGLGQDVVVPPAARQAHRPLPVGHGRDDGRADLRRGRHDREHDRLGRQPARARRRAEGLQDRDARRLSLSSPTRTTWRSRAACRPASRRPSSS